MKQKITDILNSSFSIQQSLLNLAGLIQKGTELIIKTYANDGKVLLCGNGGSAADAQHIAAELVVRFNKNRKALPAVALTTNSSVISACSNDSSFAQVFARQVQALAKPNDCLICISTSGKSPNVIEAAKEAKKKNCCVISLVGQNQAELAPYSDLVISVPSQETPRVQEAHILIGHIICELVEETLFNIKTPSPLKGED